jgi:hypothetical protein
LNLESSRKKESVISHLGNKKAPFLMTKNTTLFPNFYLPFPFTHSITV